MKIFHKVTFMQNGNVSEIPKTPTIIAKVPWNFSDNTATFNQKVPGN
jgi:hypothetical protein